MKYNEKLMHCICCPTAYHCGDFCVAAGTIQISKTDIICQKHYKPPMKSKKSIENVHVNASWCFAYIKGGSFICCEICPYSFHIECLNITSQPEGKFYIVMTAFLVECLCIMILYGSNLVITAGGQLGFSIPLMFLTILKSLNINMENFRFNF